MSVRRLVDFAFILVGLLLQISGAHASSNDHSLAPYFFVEGARGEASLSLGTTKVDAKVAGVIADVAVTQTYTNDGKVPINARYVFPASTRAAVYGMEMQLAGRRIKAKIKKREEARAEYEAAKSAGKSASLLEQDRPNVFSMNVANILPGESIEVELRYTELLVPEDGTYEFVYPTVVGPRYSSDATQGAAGIPYTKKGAPTHAFDIVTHIAAGMPVYDIASPSHAIATTSAANHDATVRLAESAPSDADFILRYRLASKDIASGLLLFEGAKENFYLLMVQPPRRPAPEVIPPREYVFVVDVSGSMHGFPLDVTKSLMRRLLGTLRPQDRFNVMLFSGGSRILSETSVPATSEHLAEAYAFVDGEPGGGGTELLSALKTAIAMPTEGAMSRSFVVVTDGYISAEREAFDYVRANLGNANVFSFGIGSSVNRHLVEGLAKAGMGEPFIATSEDEAGQVAARFAAYLKSPVLTNIGITHEGFQTSEQEPLAIPDAFANRPVLAFGKWKGKAEGTITLSGITGSGRFVSRIDVSKATPSKANAALRYLWARSRISALSDSGTPTASDEEEITQLGLTYNLLTNYTSFIAVHEVVRNTAGAADLSAALALPQGVSEHALGMTQGPEPELFWLISLALFLGILRIFRGRRRVHP